MDRGRDRQLRQIAGRLPSIAREPELAGLPEHRDELLDEERIAFGRGDDPVPDGIRQADLAEEVLGHPRRVPIGQRREEHRPLARRLAPRRPPLEQLVAGRAQEQDRPVPGVGGQVAQQVQEGRLRPLDVVQDDHERSDRGQDLEEPADAPEQLADRERRIAEADRRRHALDHRVFPDDAAQLPQGGRRRVRLEQSRTVPDDLGDRPEGDAVAVGEAPAAHDRRPRACRVEELLRQARLADARVADDRHDPTGTRRVGRVEGLGEEAQLGLAADQPGRRPAGGRRRVSHPEQPMGPHGLRLALEGE